MLAEINVIKGAYLQDILEQPEALRRTLAVMSDAGDFGDFQRGLAESRYQRIVLTGMGSSFHALYPLHLTLIRRGYPSLLVETAELIHYLEEILGPGTLVVAVSQSGQSAEVIRLLDLARGRSPVIGVTNDAGSRLARESIGCVVIRAGAESSVSCKTYLATLAALEWLGCAMTGGDMVGLRHQLQLALPAVDGFLLDWKRHVAEWTKLLDGVTNLFVTGRGPSLAAAGTGGLILKESARFPAEGMSCAAFRHGPLETVAPHVLVVIFAGDAKVAELNRQLADHIERAGGRTAFISVDARLGALRIPRTPEAARPIVEILPIQMASLALAARDGREAGRFELASKVTSIE